MTQKTIISYADDPPVKSQCGQHSHLRRDGVQYDIDLTPESPLAERGTAGQT
jgi:hypothetical protein